MPATSKLRIGPGFTLPLDAITTSTGTFGIRGSGKTNTNVVIVEELLEHHLQVAILDPTDAWWGLKSSKDGTKAGYPIIVLGGRHQDLPLAGGDGNTIADFVVDTGASVILSLRHFESDGEKRRLITDFARRLYHRKGQQDNPTPIMVVIDEASLVVPQRVLGEDAHMVGAIQRLVRQGRSSGIGVNLIDARPATVNKDVLAGVEMLITHRVTSPKDRKALQEYVEQHDPDGSARDFLKELASLEQGVAWFWSPGWLNVFESVSVRERRTFDSSRTPKAGEVAIVPVKMADIDLEAVKAKLGQSIERAKAEDPKELQKRIRELEAQLRKGAPVAAAAPDPAAVQRHVDAAVARERQSQSQNLVRLAARLDVIAKHHAQQIEDGLTNLRHEVDAARALLTQDTPAPSVGELAVRRASRAAAAPSSVAPVRREVLARVGSTNGTGVSNPSLRIVDAIAFYNSIGVAAPGKAAVAAFCGVSSKTGTWTNRLSELRTAGLIEDPSRDSIRLSAAGVKVADHSMAPRSLSELHDRWLTKVSNPSAKILRILLETYPDAIEKTALAAMVGVSPDTGTWTNRLSELRVPGLLQDVSKSEVRASDNLFPPGLS